MPDKLGGSTPEQYEETVTPENPPIATAGPASVVAGMWYYLAPAALVVVILLFALFYWGDRDEPADDVEPTTGISDEQTPGGNNPDPQPNKTKDESEYRGGR